MSSSYKLSTWSSCSVQHNTLTLHVLFFCCLFFYKSAAAAAVAAADKRVASPSLPPPSSRRVNAALTWCWLMLVREETWAHLLAHHQQTPKRAPTIHHHRIAQFVLLFWRKVQKSVLVILRCDAMRCDEMDASGYTTCIYLCFQCCCCCCCDRVMLCKWSVWWPQVASTFFAITAQHSFNVLFILRQSVSYEISFDNRHEEDNNRTRQWTFVFHRIASQLMKKQTTTHKTDDDERAAPE